MHGASHIRLSVIFVIAVLTFFS